MSNSPLPNMTEAALIDTPTLARLNEAAVVRDSFALLDERIEALDPDSRHILIRVMPSPSGAFSWSTERRSATNARER
jgi:hypothetical protein